MDRRGQSSTTRRTLRAVNPETLHALIFWLPTFLFSITVHEAAHAWAALRLGDPTAYFGGQVSLSPWPHIKRSPIGMVVVPIITTFTQGWPIGWASAPYDPAWAEGHPRRAAWMALAGPAGNLLLALVAFALIHLGLGFGVFRAPETITLTHLTVAAGPPSSLSFAAFGAELLSVVLALNTLLFAFNLLPLPPLDGATFITLVMPARIATWWREFVRMPMLAFVGILAAWRVFPMIARPLFSTLVALLYPGRY